MKNFVSLEKLSKPVNESYWTSCLDMGSTPITSTEA